MILREALLKASHRLALSRKQKRHWNYIHHKRIKINKLFGTSTFAHAIVDSFVSIAVVNTLVTSFLLFSVLFRDFLVQFSYFHQGFSNSVQVHLTRTCLGFPQSLIARYDQFLLLSFPLFLSPHARLSLRHAVQRFVEVERGANWSPMDPVPCPVWTEDVCTSF